MYESVSSAQILFMQQSRFSIQTNQKKKKYQTRNRILILITYWYVTYCDPNSPRYTLCSICVIYLWIYDFYFFSSSFPFSSSSIQYVSIFLCDWIIIVDVAHLCIGTRQRTRSGKCMSMSGLSRKLASICIWLYYDVYRSIRFVSYVYGDGLAMASGWVHVCPLYVTDLINE